MPLRKRTSGLPNITIKGVPIMSRSRSNPIPLAYSLLSAGPGAIVDEEYALLDLNALVTGGRDGCVAFVVTGDSMRADILPGYIVIVDTYREPKNGDTVVVNVNDQNCVKIFEHQTRGLYLVPKNGDFPTREVKPTDKFHVLGVLRSHIAVY